MSVGTIYIEFFLFFQNVNPILHEYIRVKV
jgi:hypothetical protein